MANWAPQFRICQVSNISPSATKDQLHALFSYIGRIEELKIYPSDSASQSQVKFAFVKFDKEKAVEVAQHLTNIVFIDRALVCVPAQTSTIPDEETALSTGGPALPGQRQLPPNVTNQEQDLGDGQKMILTIDPTLTALGLPQYPPLPATTEPSKIEEIRRTVYIGNLDKNCDGDELMEFLNTNIGEVMYLRMTTGSDSLLCAYAYVEFTNQGTVSLALQNNGIEYNDRSLRIQHSRVAIIKPQRKTADQALAEVEEAIKTNEGRDTKSDGLAREYSPYASRRRSPSPRRRSRERRERSHSPRYSKSPSRRGSRRSRSRDKRSRDRRSSSRDRREKHSRSRDRKQKRSRSKDKDRKSSKMSSKDKEKPKEKEREKSDRENVSKSSGGKDRDREKGKKDRKRSRSKTPKKERKDREKDRDHKKSSRHSTSTGNQSPKRKKEKDSDSSTAPSPKDNNSKSNSKPVANEMENEEETLRERLLERVKRKSNGSEKENGTRT